MFDPNSAEPPSEDSKGQPIATKGWWLRLGLLLGVSVGGLFLYNWLMYGELIR